MRLVVYGSRSVTVRPARLTEIVLARWGVLPSLVISGTARGADRAGELWARWMRIPLLQMPANWDAWGKRAGYMRNTEMAEKAQAGLGLWDGQSRGTAHMTSELQRLSRSYHVEIVR